MIEPPASVIAALLGAGLLGAPGQSAPATEQTPRAVRVVDVDGLKSRLEDLALFDVRSRESYVAAHVPLSIPLDIDALRDAVLAAPAPDPDVVRRVIGRAPLHPGRDVVIYDHNSPARRDCTAAWLLAYIGVENVHVLDGGFKAWFRRRNFGVYQGQPRPRGLPTLRFETLSGRPELRVDPAELSDGPPTGTAVFEILPYARVSPDDPPSARNEIRFNDLIDDAGLFVFPYHLEMLLQKKGVEPDSRILLKGPLDLAAFGWAVFAANGFDAAVVHPLVERSRDEPES